MSDRFIVAGELAGHEGFPSAFARTGQIGGDEISRETSKSDGNDHAAEESLNHGAETPAEDGILIT